MNFFIIYKFYLEKYYNIIHFKSNDIHNPPKFTKKKILSKKLNFKKDDKNKFKKKSDTKNIKLNLENQITLNNSPNDDLKIKIGLQMNNNRGIEKRKTKEYTDYELNDLNYDKAIK